MSAQPPHAPWGSLLVQAAKADLDLRARLAAEGTLFGDYHPEMEAQHLTNASLLEACWDEIGWAGRDSVGEEGAAAAMLIVQHAISRPDLQRRALAMLVEAVEAGRANALDAAYLSDRIAVFEGRPQLFGSQFDWDEDGLLSPAPIEDEAGVDARRASVGLPPMAEVIAAMRARAEAEGDRRPADHAARQARATAFLARAGWR